jgi:excisionase family DNA binding protein
MPNVEADRRGRASWLALGAAAHFLGVDATTLRGWADAGKVRVFRTPGGHRRFDPADLDALVQASAAPPRSVPPLPDAPSDRTDGPPRWLAARPWYGAVSEPSRARVRGYCAELMQIVASYIEGRPARPHHLETAQRVGSALGREVAAWGMTPPQTTEVFLHFKMRVTEALAASHEGGRGRVQSMRDADAFLARVLQAMMETYEAARDRTPNATTGGRG